MNPFDFVNAVTYTKKDIIVDDVAEKSYSPFLTNKSLSYHQDCIMYVNEMNSRKHLDSSLKFNYFLNTLRKRMNFQGKRAQAFGVNAQNNQIVKAIEYISFLKQNIKHETLKNILTQT